MKTTNVLNSSILSVCCSAKSYSQDFSQLKDAQFNWKTDYSDAENKVLECANYLMSTPLDGTNLNREYAEHFLFLWVSGTPDFTFNICKTASKIIRSNLSLLSIYFACAAKFVLENRDKLKDGNGICKNAISLLLDYCKNPENNVDQSEILENLLISA